MKKQPNFIVNVTRDDGKPVTEADFCRCLQSAIKQRIKRSAEKAAEGVRNQIEFLRTEHPELYSKFCKGSKLSDLLDEIDGRKRLVRAVRSGALR